MLRTSFSLCTDLSYELRDLQHFKAITAAFCVDFIVNKCLNKYI